MRWTVWKSMVVLAVLSWGIAEYGPQPWTASAGEDRPKTDTAAVEEERLLILPETFALNGPAARQRLIVERVHGTRFTGQVTDDLQFESSDPEVVRIEEEFAVPVGNGTATIRVRAGEQTAVATVTVSAQEEPQAWSFRNHVQSVLSKTGCNSGACHGAVAGKNGFKLSLRGYDPEADFWSISRQSRGRRIVPSDPGRSLLLTKPTGTVPHKGGLRFEVDSPEYRVLAEWIAAGHPEPTSEDPRLERLEVLPRNVTLRPGMKQQFVVRAHFSDGNSEDVTRWARFTSTNQTVAQIDDFGLAEVSGHGEGAIVAWYLANNVIATVTAPYENESAADRIAEAEPSNVIDTLVLQKLADLNLPPSPPATDSEFIRRAYLDTIGMLPSAEETRAFLESTAEDKRDRLIDELLTRPEFVDYWAHKWSDLLLVSGQRLRPDAVKSYYGWIRQHVEADTPWDEFVRQVLTAKGSTIENGAANFYSLHQDPLDMAETVSMAFLGMSINCARCHDHPLEKWTNDDYYGMANLFARVRGKGWGGDFRNGDGKRTVFVDTDGELIQPRTGQPQLPKPLDGEPIPFGSTEDRRIHLAHWLTAPENPYFTRAIVNRVWANFLGVGIVEDVDDLRLTNPPSNEALLEQLAYFLVENDYNLKKLMRAILQSNTYQRSSQPVSGNEADERYYARYYPRRIKAEVLLDVLSQATDSPTEFKDFPAGTRAVQLPDSSIESYFLETFGRPERLITCECERSDEPSMVQVLHLVNGNTLNEKLEREENRIGRLLADERSNEEVIDEAYLIAFSRYPTTDEKARILAVLQQTESESRRQVVEDLFWSLLTSREFLFNH